MIGLIGIVCVFGMVFGGYLWSGGQVRDHPQGSALRNDHDHRRGRRRLPDLQRQGGHQAHDQRSGKGVQRPALETPRLPGPSVPSVRTDPSGSAECRRARGTHRGSGGLRDLRTLSPDPLGPGSGRTDLRHAPLRLDELQRSAPGGRGSRQAPRKPKLQHAGHTAHALQAVADALPALGIVAAVLGIIKTMGSIDQPPEVLGGLIAGALVGTFLGRLPRLWLRGAVRRAA